MIWDYNGETYPCPHESRYVDCSINGTTYTWVVSVGQERARPFRIRAVDVVGHTTETNTRTIFVKEIRDEVAPVVELLTPTEDTTLLANSEIQVTARITDDIGVVSRPGSTGAGTTVRSTRARTSSTYADCSIAGDEYRWLVRVGTGERRFKVIATDAGGNRTETALQTFVLE